MQDPSTSRAVLIAVDDYVPAGALGPTPGVSDNLDKLTGLLTDPALLGMPRENCTLLRNPPDAATVLDAVYESAAAATGAFILYLAGFTLASDRQPDLYFGLAGSSPSRLYRALRFPDVAAIVRETGRAADRIVLLDYCYDGEPPSTHTTGPAILEAVVGASVLAATAKDAKSWVPSGQRLTAFTGALVQAAEAGLPGQGDTLDLAALHHQVGRNLSAHQLPAPRLWPGQGERRVGLVRNVNKGGGLPGHSG
ncbi:MAG: caspase, EACC1-associated type, partial [Actinocrinis sp.]